MEKKVKDVKNLKEKAFDIEKILKANSDLIFGYIGAFKNENDEKVRVEEKHEADVCIYSNVETGDRIEVPIEYVDAFEKNNYIFKLEPVVITLEMKENLQKKVKESKKRIKRKTKTIYSER